MFHGLGRIEVHVSRRPGVEVGVDPRVVQVLALKQRVARDFASLRVDPAQQIDDGILPDSSFLLDGLHLPALLRPF